MRWSTHEENLHVSKVISIGHIALCIIILWSELAKDVNGLLKIVRKIKEKFCSVLLDCENELKNSIPEEYELPNGEVIKIGRERFLIPEIIFDSKHIEKEFKGNF